MRSQNAKQISKKPTHIHRLIEKEIRLVLTRVGDGVGYWRKVVDGTNL